DRDHRAASRVIGILSGAIVAVGVCLTVPQLIDTISHIPPIAENIGTFTWPLQLSPAVNLAVTLVVVAASIERASRLRSSWLDDLAS
ncbi:hypothetical protein AB0100_26890, partial [Klebsiella pneumoniae]